MTKLTLDQSSAAKLAEVPGPVQLCDEDGRVLGWYQPGMLSEPPRALKDIAPLSNEELERRSKNREQGRPLKDIWRDLNRS
jgi:hypothetical protein